MSDGEADNGHTSTGRSPSTCGLRQTFRLEQQRNATAWYHTEIRDSTASDIGHVIIGLAESKFSMPQCVRCCEEAMKQDIKDLLLCQGHLHTFLQALPQRTDGKLYRIQTPQTPIARTQAYERYNMDEFPNGTNVIVAVLAYTGLLTSTLEKLRICPTLLARPRKPHSRL